MKIFKFFVVENLMVAGLPLCESNFDSITDRFGDATLVSVTCRQPFRNPSDNGKVLPNTLDIEPPMIEEVNGNEMTELEAFMSPIQGAIESVERPPPCQCPYVESWNSLDSSDGTGDHESFM